MRLIDILNESFSNRLDSWFEIVKVNTKKGGVIFQVKSTQMAPLQIKLTIDKLERTQFQSIAGARKRLRDEIRKAINDKVPTDYKKIFKRNVEFAKKAMEFIAKQYNGEVRTSVSRSQYSKETPSTYISCYFKGSKYEFNIRIATHLTYGFGHDGYLPFEDYSRKTLKSTDIQKAFNKFKSNYPDAIRD
jgi:histone H3/H4